MIRKPVETPPVKGPLESLVDDTADQAWAECGRVIGDAIRSLGPAISKRPMLERELFTQRVARRFDVSGAEAARLLKEGRRP